MAVPAEQLIGGRIEWTAELSVGIQEIDEQHKILVELLNQMYDAIQEQRGSEVVNEIVDELIEYTRVHFTVEESLMRILDYPHYRNHKQEHEKLLQQCIEMRQHLDQGEGTSTFEILHFLRRWLTDHIMLSDMEYGPFFLDRGVKAKWSEERSWMGKIFHIGR